MVLAVSAALALLGGSATVWGQSCDAVRNSAPATPTPANSPNDELNGYTVECIGYIANNLIPLEIDNTAPTATASEASDNVVTIRNSYGLGDILGAKVHVSASATAKARAIHNILNLVPDAGLATTRFNSAWAGWARVTGGAAATANENEFRVGQVAIGATWPLSTDMAAAGRAEVLQAPDTASKATANENKVVLDVAAETRIAASAPWLLDYPVDFSYGLYGGWAENIDAAGTGGQAEANANELRLTLRNGDVSSQLLMLAGGYAAGAAATSADGNLVEITGETPAMHALLMLWGGYAAHAAASGTGLVSASANTVRITDINRVEALTGGSAKGKANVVADDNVVVITGVKNLGESETSLYGGLARYEGTADNQYTLSASRNTLSITQSGGDGHMAAAGVISTEGSYVGDDGSASEKDYLFGANTRPLTFVMEGNHLTTDGQWSSQSLLGAYFKAWDYFLGSTVTLTENAVDIALTQDMAASALAAGVEIYSPWLSNGTFTLRENAVNISGATGDETVTLTQIYGVRSGMTSISSGTALAEANAVNIRKVTFNAAAVEIAGASLFGRARPVVGGDTNITLHANTVTLEDVRAQPGSLTVIGGDAMGSMVGNTLSGNFLAAGNVVTLKGTVTGLKTVAGGAAGCASGAAGCRIFPDSAIYSATGNTVNIEGEEVDLSHADLYGGMGHSPSTGTVADLFTGNTLNLKASRNLTAGSLQNFEFLNFYLPADVAVGETILTVSSANGNSGVADIRNSTVRVGISGTAAPLAVGDEVTLIDAETLLTGTTAAADKYTAGTTLTQGVTVEYEIDLLDDDASDGATDGSAKKLVARVRTQGSGGRGKAEAKSLSEGWLSGMALLTQASDFIARDGISSALAATRLARAETEQGKLVGFGKVSGGAVRYQTGSHIDVDGYGVLAGVAAPGDDLTFGGFFEYGKGNTSTHNHFASGTVKGTGNVEYRGLGVLAHYGFGDGYWLEGSLRGGRVETDFRSHDLVDSNGVHARYDGSARYISAHAGSGKTWNVGDDRVDAYVQWLWTREGSDRVRLSTGERVEFKAVNSNRLRMGGRYNHDLTTVISGFVGLAWEHEFNGKARATTHVGSASHHLATPDMKGDSGVLELGVSSLPKSSLILEASVQAYGGKREGVTGGVRMNYRF